MKKLLLFALVAASFGFNVNAEELLERMDLPEGTVNMYPEDSPFGYLYYVVYKDYTVHVLDRDFVCRSVLDNVVPNQGWGNCMGDVLGKVELMRPSLKVRDNFIYFVTSKPDDPSQWWGVKDFTGKLLFKETGRSATFVYRGALYNDAGEEGLDFCWVDGRMYKINHNKGGITFTNLSETEKAGYPNPVKQGEIFSIDVPELKKRDNIKLIIADVKGCVKSEVVMTEDDSRIVSVDTGAYDPGMYVYSFNDGYKVVKSGRMIVE